MEDLKLFSKQTGFRISGIALALFLAVGSIFAVNCRPTVPELVSYVDMDDIVMISEDEIPLANMQVTTSTKTKKSTKKIKLSKKAAKTYTAKGKVKASTSKKTSITPSSKTTIETTVKTQIINKYTKGSKVCKRTTIRKTIVTKTVVATSGSNSTSGNSSSASSTPKTLEELAPKADSRLVSAWNTLGFSIQYDSDASFSGYFSSRTRTITLKYADETIYHELGHFLSFVAGNMDTSSWFTAIYNSEKDLVTSYDKGYVTSTSSEYFAESYRDYALHPASLKASRPQTYTAIETVLEKVTDAQVKKIATVYGTLWNQDN